MSTITKIGGRKVREDRAMRAALVREMAGKAEDFLRQFGPADNRTVQVATARNFLRHVARSPQRTGARKNQLFHQLARELVCV